MTPGYRERLDPEGFPVCLACLDLTEHLVLRETAESKETEARLELEWKVQWVLRDLMDCLDLQVLESQASRGSEDPLESKVGESEAVSLIAWCALPDIPGVPGVSGARGMAGPPGVTGARGLEGTPGHCESNRDKRRKKKKKRNKSKKKTVIP